MATKCEKLMDQASRLATLEFAPEESRDLIDPSQPSTIVQPFLDRKYVVGKAVGKNGLHSRLFAATTKHAASMAYMQEFIRIMREVSFATLKGIDAA